MKITDALDMAKAALKSDAPPAAVREALLEVVNAHEKYIAEVQVQPDEPNDIVEMDLKLTDIQRIRQFLEYASDSYFAEAEDYFVEGDGEKSEEFYEASEDAEFYSDLFEDAIENAEKMADIADFGSREGVEIGGEG